MYGTNANVELLRVALKSTFSAVQSTSGVVTIVKLSFAVNNSYFQDYYCTGLKATLNQPQRKNSFTALDHEFF
jgi:hypothetical protein